MAEELDVTFSQQCMHTEMYKSRKSNVWAEQTEHVAL